jgi:hypothetical protein
MHREARRVLHIHKVTPATRKILGFDGTISDTEIIRICDDIVQTDMDQIGTMAKHNLFNKDIFLERYSSSIIIEWARLEDVVLKGRKRRGEDYRKNFQYLKNEAVAYRKKYSNEQDPTEIVNKYLKMEDTI